VSDAVVMRGIVKHFGGVEALKGVDLTVRAGEIHALLGENGAGKTTLMNVLYGLYQPDAGQIEIEGGQVQLRTPQAAIGAGIGMVHQHFMLVPTLTVAENMVMGERGGRCCGGASCGPSRAGWRSSARATDSRSIPARGCGSCPSASSSASRSCVRCSETLAS